MMRSFFYVMIAMFLTFHITTGCTLAGSSKQKEITRESLKTQEEIASYGMGLGMGKNFLKKIQFELNVELFLKGIQDGYSEDGKQLMTDEEIQKEMRAFQEKLKLKMEAEKGKMAGENKAKGEKYLAENKKKKGVVVLPSGLQYKIIKDGKGAKPKETDTVSVHYRGTTIDGKEFDSSFKRNKPATFGVKRVVKGWTEALLLMKVGSKWQLCIPSELAYGERGAGRDIGPNETLIFEVELLGIEEPKANKEKKP